MHINVEGARRLILPAAITGAGLALLSCRGEEPPQPTPKDNPTPIVVQCDPETYAQQLAIQGIPTPVGIGGGETAPGTLERIAEIREKINRCEKLTDEDGLDLINFNLTHPQKGMVPTTQATLPPDITPDPKPSETAVSDPPEDEEETTPCVITNPELCAQAERIQIVRTDIDDRVETYIALNPTDKKTPFFVPEDGRLLDKIPESGNPFSGLSARLYKPNPPGGAYIVIGLTFDNMLQVENPEKDSLMGYSDDEITNYGAKVLITITKRTPNGPVIDEEALKEHFSNAYNKPIKAIYTVTGPTKPNVSPSYAPKPPQ